MNNDKIVIDLVLSQFDDKVRQASTLFATLGAKAALVPVAPGRNKVIYLLGHLLAVHDRLFEGLAIGERTHPEVDSLFLSTQQEATATPITRACWLRGSK